MKNYITLISATLLMAFAISASAAKPTSITFQSDAKTAEGVEFASYVVKCSNGQSRPLTAWDQRKKWCVGSESVENCTKKQIKAAKKACK